MPKASLQYFYLLILYSTGRQWIQNHAFAETFSVDSIQCFGLYEWGNFHITQGLLIGVMWNTAWDHYVSGTTS
jgi:hypothetical protein